MLWNADGKYATILIYKSILKLAEPRKVKQYKMFPDVEDSLIVWGKYAFLILFFKLHHLDCILEVPESEIINEMRAFAK